MYLRLLSRWGEGLCHKRNGEGKNTSHLQLDDNIKGGIILGIQNSLFFIGNWWNWRHQRCCTAWNICALHRWEMHSRWIVESCTTCGQDVCDILVNQFKHWHKLMKSIATDDWPSMANIFLKLLLSTYPTCIFVNFQISFNVGLVTLLKKDNPQLISYHCITHNTMLTAKLNGEFSNTLKNLIMVIKYLWSESHSNKCKLFLRMLLCTMIFCFTTTYNGWALEIH